MRRWMMGAVFSLGMSAMALAQGTEIEGVIGSQIEAFKADDFVTAFTFASPNIRGMFLTPDNFGRMVTQGYPMVWRPATVAFLDLRLEGGLQVQRVEIVDSEGRVHQLDYYMIETENGWKINGVQLLKTQGATA